MKKLLLYYSTLIYLVSFLITAFGLFFSNDKFSAFFLFFFSSINLLALFFIFKSNYVQVSYYSLSLLFFLQSFTFLFFGISYKFVIGPNISLYLINYEFDVTSFTFMFYNLVFHVNKIENIDHSLFGINFIQLILCLLFFSFAVKERSK